MIVFVRTQSTFTYFDNNPNYVVGVSITPNNPSLTTIGTYLVAPTFSRGLSIDTSTGIITGVPIEEYVGTYTITFTESGSQMMFTSVLHITSIFNFIISLG